LFGLGLVIDWNIDWHFAGLQTAVHQNSPICKGGLKQ
jgi:hypothetical protein